MYMYCIKFLGNKLCVRAFNYTKYYQTQPQLSHIFCKQDMYFKISQFAIAKNNLSLSYFK